MRGISALSWAGIRVQATKGTPVSPTAALPLSGGDGIEPQTLEDYFDAPVGRIYTYTFALRGRWFSGDLPVYLIPGTFTSDIFNLVFDRDATTFQPPLFTAEVGLGNVVTKRVWDAVVQSASITLDNRTPAQATLTVLAAEGSYLAAGAAAPALASEDMPWLSRETTVTLNGTSMDNVLRSLEVRVENNPVDAADMIRFGAAGDGPVELIATRQDVSGRLELDLADASEWLLTPNAPFIRVPLVVTFTRGATTNSIEIPTVNIARPVATAAGASTSVEAITLEFRAVFTAAEGSFVAWS